jgi:hypothetical protein
MVVETEEEQPKPIGAVAAFGGRVVEVFADVKQVTTSGHRKVFWPLMALISATFLIVTGLAQDGWLRGAAIVLLLLIAVWVVADDRG